MQRNAFQLLRLVLKHSGWKIGFKQYAVIKQLLYLLAIVEIWRILSLTLLGKSAGFCQNRL